MHANAKASPHLVGETIADRYRLLSELGSGGMGAVFSAVDLRSQAGERVAVKLIHTGSEDSQSRKRFAREARRLQTLDIDGVVRVLDAGEDEVHGPFLVMELLSGESLEDRLKRGPLSIPTTLAVMDALLAALERVHEAGLMHRDLKPANIFLARNPGGGEAAKILDFGIARSLEGHKDSQTLTTPGAVIGTPRYMAPEQVLAPMSVNERTDVYAMALIVYECLTGRPPHCRFSGSEVIRAVAAIPHPSIVEVYGDCPPGLARAIDRAMSYEMEDRFASAAAFRVALARALADDATETASSTRDEEVPNREMSGALDRTTRPGLRAIKNAPAPKTAKEETAREETTVGYRRRTSKSMAVGLTAGVLAAIGIGGFVFSRDDSETEVLEQLPAVSAAPNASEAEVREPSFEAQLASADEALRLAQTRSEVEQARRAFAAIRDRLVAGGADDSQASQVERRRLAEANQGVGRAEIEVLKRYRPVDGLETVESTRQVVAFVRERVRLGRLAFEAMPDDAAVCRLTHLGHLAETEAHLWLEVVPPPPLPNGALGTLLSELRSGRHALLERARARYQSSIEDGQATAHPSEVASGCLAQARAGLRRSSAQLAEWASLGRMGGSEEPTEASPSGGTGRGTTGPEASRRRTSPNPTQPSITQPSITQPNTTTAVPHWTGQRATPPVEIRAHRSPILP